MARLPEDLERLLHDLRGPLNALAMHAEVLKRVAAEDPAASASVRTIQQETDRLSDMLVSAMGIVALERTESAAVNLRAAVQEAISELGAKDVGVADEAFPTVTADRRLLTLALTALIRNAVEATVAAGPGTPPPEITVAPGRDGRVGVVVRDYGAGLRSTNPKVLIRLQSSTKPGHRGLGLIAAERIARLHGGTLGFEAPGQGAQVTLLVSADRA